MITARTKFLALLITMIAAATAHAWNFAGHMTTGAIAYDTLKASDPQALAKIVAILKQHPHYRLSSDTETEVADGADKSTDQRRRSPPNWAKRLEAVDPADRDQALFMLAARWPDDIRNLPDYNHGEWHYIDYPYIPPGQPESVKSAPPPQPNIEVAYRTNVDIIKGNGTDAEKAIALCWIFHLTGDSHQPLHSVSMFNTDFPAPLGDKGGNLEFIRAKADGAPIKLHAFWDGLVIGSDDTRDIRKKAIELRAAYPRASFNAPAKDGAAKRTAISASSRSSKNQKGASAAPPQISPADMAGWIQESHQLAKTDVYVDGKLKYGTNYDNAALLPADYVANAKSVGDRRLTQSGYRLAGVLANLASGLSPEANSASVTSANGAKSSAAATNGKAEATSPGTTKTNR